MKQNRLVQIERREKFVENDFQNLIVALNQEKWSGLTLPQLPLEDLADKVAGNVVTPKSAPIPDCITCGACCAFLLCVAVKPIDATPSEYFWSVTNQLENQELTVDRFMRRDDESLTCASLGGRIGETVGCRIYEQRPQVCHEFEAGSDKCHGLRRAYNLEPELSEERKLEAQFRLEIAQRDAPMTILYSKIIAQPDAPELLILVLLKEGNSQLLHVYHPDKEVWLQSEFAGLTISEALQLIESRKANSAFQSEI